jgi:hypothetical protein
MEWQLLLALLIAVVVTALYSQAVRFLLQKAMPPIEIVLLGGTVFVSSFVLQFLRGVFF